MQQLVKSIQGKFASPLVILLAFFAAVGVSSLIQGSAAQSSRNRVPETALIAQFHSVDAQLASQSNRITDTNKQIRELKVQLASLKDNTRGPR